MSSFFFSKSKNSPGGFFENGIGKEWSKQMKYMYLVHSSDHTRQNLVYSAKIGNNERAMKRLYEDNNRLKSDYAKVNRGMHDASNPDISIGTEERMWKNHKWVNRKRDSKGRWVYDYGYGYGKSDPEQIKRNSRKIKFLSDQNKLLKDAAKKNEDKDIMANPMSDPIRAAQLFIDKLLPFKKPLISL